MKTVAYSSPLIPAEWLAAHGVRPWRMLPQGADRSPRAREGLCPFAQAMAQEWLADPLQFDGMILATTCDQMRRWHEVLAAQSPRPVFLMNIPAIWQNASSSHMYMDELSRLGSFLEALGGCRPTDDQLARTMLAFGKARQALQAAEVSLCARRFVERLHQLCRCATEEMETFAQDVAAEARLNAVGKDGVPVAVVGGPMTQRELLLLDLIEQAGGRVVLNATESGERVLPAPFETQNLHSSPLTELASAYFGSIGEIFRRPDSMLFGYLGRELSRRRPKGIILVRQVWCDLWHAQVRRIRQDMNLPLLDLDLGGQEPPATLANRVQAFLEVLQ